jgi:adenosylmethionine-8-amino-7-oxononanoate aminotransferase
MMTLGKGLFGGTVALSAVSPPFIIKTDEMRRVAETLREAILVTIQ